MIRSIWVAVVGVATLIVIGGLAIIGPYLRFPRSYYDWAARAWSRCVLWASGSPVRVIGLENIDRERPQIVAANHQSMYDIFALATALPVMYHFVAKQELRSVPVFGRATEAAGHVFIDRGNRSAAIESLKLAGRKLREERSSAIVFPEGTRSLTGDLQPFKKGPFVMAIESGVPIVPTVVDGTLDILPKRGLRISAHRITVWFGEPVDSRNYGHDTRDALIAIVHARMARMLATLREPEGYDGPRWLWDDPAVVGGPEARPVNPPGHGEGD